MVYQEHRPPAPLSAFVERFWYARTDLDSGTPYRERVLPTGKVQVVLNLCGDHLTNCGPAPSHVEKNPLPPALILGASTRYDVIDSRDLGELMGIIFQPHGFSAFGLPAQEVLEKQVDMPAVWGSTAAVLYAQLRETSDMRARWRLLETFLAARLCWSTHPAVLFSLRSIHDKPGVKRVERLAQECGLSRRRFGQLFREQVGLTPKSFIRIQRFQRALREVRSGRAIRWADLAQDCGFCDQAHLVKEFQSFSGISPEVYVAHQTQWTNHVRLTV